MLEFCCPSYSVYQSTSMLVIIIRYGMNHHIPASSVYWCWLSHFSCHWMIEDKLPGYICLVFLSVSLFSHWVRSNFLVCLFGWLDGCLFDYSSFANFILTKQQNMLFLFSLVISKTIIDEKFCSCFSSLPALHISYAKVFGPLPTVINLCLCVLALGEIW